MVTRSRSALLICIALMLTGSPAYAQAGASAFAQIGAVQDWILDFWEWRLDYQRIEISVAQRFNEQGLSGTVSLLDLGTDAYVSGLDLLSEFDDMTESFRALNLNPQVIGEDWTRAAQTGMTAYLRSHRYLNQLAAGGLTYEENLELNDVANSWYQIHSIWVTIQEIR